MCIPPPWAPNEWHNPQPKPNPPVNVFYDHRVYDVLNRIERQLAKMVDITTAANDIIAELVLVGSELVAAIKAGGTPDPAVQAAADALEAAVAAAKAADPTPAP